MAPPPASRIAVVGLGYVGLPIAVAFGKQSPAVGFDIDRQRVADLQQGLDRTKEVSAEELHAARVTYTCDPSDLKWANFIIVAVPTPVSNTLQPDMSALMRASELIGGNLAKGTVVVYESTVFPGATEEVCQPILERSSGLKCGVDFSLGYSPERINPGDKEHTLERVVKVVAAQDEQTLNLVAGTYSQVVKAGVHRAPSIKVAEAAKVIENTQRDLNVALMNELALIFNRLGIDTSSVLRAARTKWNFLNFSPGLVGGHCIGVDPYYLTFKAESVGYHPQVILAGRRINNAMGKFIAEQTVKLLSKLNRPLKSTRVAVLGLTFKENVPDLRNSRVPDIIRELEDYGIEVIVHDPLADPGEAEKEYGVRLVPWDQVSQVDGLVIAVAHRVFVDMETRALVTPLDPAGGGVVVDVKGMIEQEKLPTGLQYWRL